MVSSTRRHASTASGDKRMVRLPAERGLERGLERRRHFPVRGQARVPVAAVTVVAVRRLDLEARDVVATLALERGDDVLDVTASLGQIFAAQHRAVGEEDLGVRVLASDVGDELLVGALKVLLAGIAVGT